MLRALLGTTALTLALGSASFAYAQQATSAPPPGAASQTAPYTSIAPQSAQLGTVLVTAERRVANVQKTAISISTISGKTISQTGLQTLDAVLAEVPALTVAGDAHGSQISIRGVGSNGDANFIDADVVSMYDDVYNGRAEGTSSAMYDVNHVEILRGPQGTLYGRNAIGGAINILSNDPTFAKYTVDLNLGAGNYNLLHADGAVNIPITDVLAFRAAGEVTSRDGYISNGGQADHSTGYRLKMYYRPNDTFSLLGDIDWWHQTGLGNDTVSVANPFTQLGGPPFFNWPVNNKDPWKQLDNDHPADTDNYLFSTYSLHAIYNLDDLAVITFIPSYSYNDRYELSNLVVGDTPQIHASLGAGAYTDTQYTGELRVSNAPDSKVIWVAGLYYLNDKNYGSAAGATTSASAGEWYAQQGSNAPTSSKSIFAQVKYPVTDTFRITGGLRYNQDEKQIGFGVCTTDIGTLTCTAPSSSYYYFLPTHNYTQKYTAITYKAGIEYDVTPTAMAYAQVSSGYKAGGFDTNAYPPSDYKPEHLTAYEVGLKSRWLDDSLQINAEAYYYQYTNLQIQYSFNGCPPVTPAIADAAAAAGGTGNFCAADTTAFAAGDQGPFQQFVLNAASSTNTGGEAEIKWRVDPDDEIDLAPAVIRAYYGNIAASTGYGFLTNTPVIQNPKFSITAAYEHDFDLPSGVITGHADVKYSTGYWLNVAENMQPTNFANDYQNAFFIENANATYTPYVGNYTITMWGKNLGDKAVKDFAFPLGRSMLNDPRTFGATVSLKY